MVIGVASSNTIELTRKILRLFFKEKYMECEKLLVKLGFTIDKNGNVYNKDGVALKGKLKGGYKAIAIRIDGKRKDVKIHRFQAYMKYGDVLFEDGVVVRHLNNNKLDNSWGNIEIGSPYDNSMDNPPEERMRYAINASKASNKYGKDFVEKIRKEHSNGITYKEIMDKYNLPKSSVSHIINNDYVVHD